MKYSRLLYIVHLPIFFFLTTNLCIADTYPAMLPATAVPQFRVQRNPEEGFAAGTLVRTPSEYKPIESITEHDILLDGHAEPKRVIKVVKRIADRSVHVTIDGQNICMGYEQAVRLPYTMQWMELKMWQKQSLLPEEIF